MVRFYASLLLLASFQLSAQTFPYLNASTANQNEFPVDKDTNIYMFHGNRLVKTDKNFNTVWANTYSGIHSFDRILLSKTGSLYCTGTNSNYSVFGKINADGTVAWLKSGSIACSKLLLDRNNNLVVSGAQGSFLKLDTNGNVLKYKMFAAPASGNSYLNGFSIIEDSAGYYKFVGVGYQGMGPARDLAIHYYNDNTDLFTKTERIAELGVPTDTHFGWKLITSKFSDRFYVQSTLSGQSSEYTDIRKFSSSGKLSWLGKFSAFHGSSYVFWGHVEESSNGDLFCSVNTGNYNIVNHTSAFIKVDSSGKATPSTSAVSMLYNYPVFVGNPPVHAPRVIHANNYYFDVSGQHFQSNPLTVQKFDSLLSYPCSSTVSITYQYASASLSFSLAAYTPSIVTAASYTFPPHAVTRTPVGFNVTANYCSIVAVDELSRNNREVRIFPSPARDKIHFDEILHSAEVFDVNGKKITASSGTSSIDVSDLPQGIYFLRINTGEAEFTKKFLKE